MGRLDWHATAYNLYNLVWPAACEVAEVRGMLERVGLEKETCNQAGALSGGQQQRTSAARALYRRPSLIGDESVSVGHLMGRHADALDYRMDGPKGINL